VLVLKVVVVVVDLDVEKVVVVDLDVAKDVFLLVLNTVVVDFVVLLVVFLDVLRVVLVPQKSILFHNHLIYVNLRLRI